MEKRVYVLIIFWLCVAALAFLTACNNETPNIHTQQTHFTYGSMSNNLEVYTIDSCEYIGNLYNSNCDVLSHKGNCKNPIHNHIVHDTIFIHDTILNLKHNWYLIQKK